MSQKIQVFSPHFDDAALSCGEHILRWSRAGYRIEVFTVFSQFESHFLSQDSIDFMKSSGVSGAQTFQHERSKEDAAAMKALGVSEYHWLGFTDGGFRSEHEQPTYESHKKLFAGEILDSTAWQKKVEKALKEVIHPDALVVFPLGVGKHADHLLIHNLLEQNHPVEKQLMFVDVPYALSFHNWTSSQLLTLLKMKKSLTWSSSQKIRAVQAYTSQVPTLFYDEIWEYPECVLGDA